MGFYVGGMRTTTLTPCCPAFAVLCLASNIDTCGAPPSCSTKKNRKIRITVSVRRAVNCGAHIESDTRVGFP